MWKLCSFEQSFILLFCAVEPKIGNDNYRLHIIYICYHWKEFYHSYQMTSPLPGLLYSKSLPIYLGLITSLKIRFEALWLISKAFREYNRSRAEIYITRSKNHIPKDLFFTGPQVEWMMTDLTLSNFYLYILHMVYSLKTCNRRRNRVYIIRFLFHITWNEMNCKKMIDY